MVNRRTAVFGYGFIGRNLVERLQARGVGSITVFSRGPRPADLPAAIDWAQGDFNDLDAHADVLDGIDTVYHLIASTVPADTHYRLAEELNQTTYATLRFVELCCTRSVSRLVFASSASVYGTQPHQPITEDAVTNPTSAHGIHKLMIEKYLLMYQHMGRIDVRIARISNPYGDHQNIHGRQGLIAIAVGRLLSGEPLHINGDGSAVRDFIHVRDVAEGLVDLSQPDMPFSVVNIASNLPVSLLRTVELINTLAAHPLPVVLGPRVETDLEYSCLSASKLQSMGWRPEIGLDAGLKALLGAHGLLRSRI